jgi:hypothetical protein
VYCFEPVDDKVFSRIVSVIEFLVKGFHFSLLAHPEPLNVTGGEEKTLFISPAQFGHLGFGSSLNPAITVNNP